MATGEAKAIDEIRAFARAGAAGFKVVAGFDGFVDEIIHAVARREGAGRYERIKTIGEFAARAAAAAGVSANIELVPARVKLGGNGPIMADALGSLGADVTYIGNLGKPRIHPVFEEFARRRRVISLEEPAHTDALEFQDGKLMLGKMIVLEKLDWRLISAAVPPSEMAALTGGAHLLAMVNWTMLPWMTEIWKSMLEEVCPELPRRTPQAPRLAFFDLADPRKRSDEDLADALRTIERFSDYFDVILGLNESETARVASLLTGADRSGGAAEENCAAAAARLNVHAVVSHPVDRAVVSTRLHGGAWSQQIQRGFFTETPLIATGAGDHFNAGFCMGRLAGLSPRASLLAGVGCSGYYVRTGESPGLEALARFVETGNTSS